MRRGEKMDHRARKRYHGLPKACIAFDVKSCKPLFNLVATVLMPGCVETIGIVFSRRAIMAVRRALSTLKVCHELL